jgi:hypothetical protein
LEHFRLTACTKFAEEPALEYRNHAQMTFKDKFQSRRAKEHRLRGHKDLLVQSVRAHIPPVYIQQGFSVAPRVRSGPGERKSAGTFPFELRRARPDGGVDLVEIQFMTYQRAAFRINAGVAPKDGMMTVTGHRPAEEVCIHWLNEYFEMHARPWLLCRIPHSSHNVECRTMLHRVLPVLSLLRPASLVSA